MIFGSNSQALLEKSNQNFMEVSRQEYWSGQLFPSPGDLPNAGIKLRSLALQVDVLSAEPPGKPQNTEVGSLSLPQRIFPTEESNWGLLHCKQTLYQLSYQGSPGARHRDGPKRSLVFITCYYSELHCAAFFFLMANHQGRHSVHQYALSYQVMLDALNICL